MADPKKPRAPFAPWDRRELPGIFSVEESARRVGNYKWIEMRLVEVLGGWVATVPELDVRENTNSNVVEAELPGVDEKDVSVTLANGMLTVKGEKKHEKEEKGENYYLAERSFGSFERSIRLPDTIDERKVEAKFDKGVLRITAAKKPEAVKAERRIEIKKT